MGQLRDGNEVVQYPGLLHMFTILQPLFGSGLDVRRTQHRVKVRLYGEQISPAAVPLLVHCLALALGLSLAVFVTVLSVDDSQQLCNNKFDCFVFNYSHNTTPIKQIEDCSQYKEDNDITIRCFGFSLRLLEALGSSGGILALTTLGLSLYTALLFSLARVTYCRRNGLCGIMLLVTFGCIIFMSCLLWIIPFGVLRHESFELVKNWESFLVYYYTVVYLALVVTLLPCCVPRYQQDFRRCGLARRWGYEPPQTEETDEEDDEEEVRRSWSDGQRRGSGYRVRNNNSSSTSQAPRHRYYGSVEDSHQSHTSQEYTDTPTVTSPLTEQSSSAQQNPYTGSTESPAGAGNFRDRVKSKECQTQSAHSDKQRLGVERGSKELKGGTGGDVRRKKKHLSEMEMGGSDQEKGRESDGKEEEWSTTSQHSEEKMDEEIESSSTQDMLQGGQGSQERGRKEREGERNAESAKIRAVLTGGAVENGKRRRVSSIHTDL